MLRWAVKTRSGFTVDDDSPVQVGMRRTITARVLGIRIHEPVRVVAGVRWSLEVIPVCVDDVDEAKIFYEEQVGFRVDLDVEIGGTGRVVQLTPPGSASSIHVKAGATRIDGRQLVVDDVDVARAELAERGVDVSAVMRFEEGRFHEGRGGAWNALVFFSDPAGNAWVIQERPSDR